MYGINAQNILLVHIWMIKKWKLGQELQSLLRDKYRKELHLLCDLNKHACYQLSWNCHWEKYQDTSGHSTYLLAYCVPQLSKCVAEAKMGTRSFHVSSFTAPGVPWNQA